MATRAPSRRAARPVRGSAASPWRMAEAEELRHTAENGRAEQALQVQAVWRPGVTTAALAAKRSQALPQTVDQDSGPPATRKP